jgi:hypothetical protein
MERTHGVFLWRQRQLLANNWDHRGGKGVLRLHNRSRENEGPHIRLDAPNSPISNRGSPSGNRGSTSVQNRPIQGRKRAQQGRTAHVALQGRGVALRAGHCTISRALNGGGGGSSGSLLLCSLSGPGSCSQAIRGKESCQLRNCWMARRA